MRIEKRLQDSQLMVYLSPLLALLLTLISGALLFALLGRPPLGSLYTFFIAPSATNNSGVPVRTMAKRIFSIKLRSIKRYLNAVSCAFVNG